MLRVCDAKGRKKFDVTSGPNEHENNKIPSSMTSDLL